MCFDILSCLLEGHNLKSGLMFKRCDFIRFCSWWRTAHQSCMAVLCSQLSQDTHPSQSFLTTRNRTGDTFLYRIEQTQWDSFSHFVVDHWDSPHLSECPHKTLTLFPEMVCKILCSSLGEKFLLFESMSKYMHVLLSKDMGFLKW